MILSGFELASILIATRVCSAVRNIGFMQVGSAMMPAFWSFESQLFQYVGSPSILLSWTMKMSGRKVLSNLGSAAVGAFDFCRFICMILSCILLLDLMFQRKFGSSFCIIIYGLLIDFNFASETEAVL